MQYGSRLMDEIINFYKNELSTKNLVLKYIKKYYFSNYWCYKNDIQGINKKEYKERKNLIDMVKRIRLEMFINDID